MHISMFGKFINLKGIILAFGIAFIFCFFTGIFWNYKQNYQEFNEKHWFYINRGIRVPWNGVSAVDRSVEFPFIKMPFTESKAPLIDAKVVKVIDLSRFIPLFLTVFLICYIFTFFIGKVADENKKLNILLFPIYMILFIGCLFFYFFWFPRV